VAAADIADGTDAHEITHEERTAIDRALSDTNVGVTEQADRARVWIDALLVIAAVRDHRPPADATVAELIWTAAHLVADIARGRRAHWKDDTDALAGTLHDVMDRLAPTTGSPTRPGIPRPPRYEIRIAFDHASGHLLWSMNSNATRRWDIPIDHYDLPIPIALAARVTALIDRYDAANTHLGGGDGAWLPASWVEFSSDCDETLDELELTLGTAYNLKRQPF